MPDGRAPRLTPEAALASAGGSSRASSRTARSRWRSTGRTAWTASPHTRDELCVVIAGTGAFAHGERRRPFQPGEVLFVPAGVAHRFEDFTDDFATWGFFFGPGGGAAVTGA